MAGNMDKPFVYVSLLAFTSLVDYNVVAAYTFESAENEPPV